MDAAPGRSDGLMKAVGFTEFGGPEVLKVLEVDDPHAGAGEVRVKVEAFDVTPANTYLRSGVWDDWEETTKDWEGATKFAPDLAYYVPGWDFSGTVDEVGAGADAKAGDRVVGLPVDSYINGPYAQYIVTSAQSVVRAPANTDNVAAATFLDHVVARGDDVAQRIREVAPNGVDALVDCAALHDLIVPAVRDSGSIATPPAGTAPQ